MNPIAILLEFGRSIIDFFTALGAGAIMFWDALRGVAAGNVRARDRITEQMAVVGIESMPIVLITLLFGGMVLGLHTAKQFVLFGAGQYVGGVVALSMAREVAPTLTGIVVAARVGSSFAAEVGSMKITNQIDALRALATNPVRYLVTPRLIAAAIMLPILTMFANVTGMLGGALVAINAGVSYQSFINSASSFLQVYDIAGGLLKTMIFGIIITITSCYIGMTTDGGAAGVGRSTTSAVVWSIVLLYVSNFVMSWMLYAFR
ncbi:MAG TPA: ABC transporter permease [Armatimonadota bacterium]|nr:ABC transporter permease [Armatimonadota bacterium]